MTPSKLLLWVSGLLVVVCAAVVTGAAVGTLTGGGRVTAEVSRPTLPTAAEDPATVPSPAGPNRPSADPLDDRSAPAAPARAAATRVDLGPAGSVLLGVSDGRLVVQSVRPAPGWSVDRVEDGGSRAEVRLRGRGGQARVEAAVVAGRVVVDRVRLPDA